MVESRKFKVLVGASVLGVLLAAGVAFAAWTGTGSGSGTARATVAVTVTINPTDGTPDLYPGFTDGDVYFTLTNGNPYPITFTSMTPGAITATPATCPSSSVTVDPATGFSLLSPPGTSGQLSIADVVSMSLDAPDACQGASFNVVLTLTGTQS
jgi:hypothetical protein